VESARNSRATTFLIRSIAVLTSELVFSGRPPEFRCVGLEDKSRHLPLFPVYFVQADRSRLGRGLPLYVAGLSSPSSQSLYALGSRALIETGETPGWRGGRGIRQRNWAFRSLAKCALPCTGPTVGNSPRQALVLGPLAVTLRPTPLDEGV